MIYSITQVLETRATHPSQRMYFCYLLVVVPVAIIIKKEKYPRLKLEYDFFFHLSRQLRVERIRETCNWHSGGSKAVLRRQPSSAVADETACSARLGLIIHSRRSSVRKGLTFHGLPLSAVTDGYKLKANKNNIKQKISKVIFVYQTKRP